MASFDFNTFGAGFDIGIPSGIGGSVGGIERKTIFIENLLRSQIDIQEEFTNELSAITSIDTTEEIIVGTEEQIRYTETIPLSGIISNSSDEDHRVDFGSIYS